MDNSTNTGPEQEYIVADERQTRTVRLTDRQFEELHAVCACDTKMATVLGKILNIALQECHRETGKAFDAVAALFGYQDARAVREDGKRMKINFLTGEAELFNDDSATRKDE